MDPTSGERSDEEELAPGTRVGDYVVSGRLGQGGMATVYAGLHPLIGKRVAIKVIRRELCMSAEAVDRFLQEARAVVAIDHPNIVDIFTFGRLEDGRCYYVMELLDGRTLADKLEIEGPLTLIEALGVLQATCDALHAAHCAGVVHRDLKPQNVILSPGGGVKLVDFGIAKLLRPRPEVTAHTRPGTTIGTPDYISPEQARNPDVGPSADIYSLGVVAFEMLTGQLPFAANNSADMLVAHLSLEPERPSAFRPTLPRSVDTLVGRLLAKDPSARPTLPEVRAAIDRIEPTPKLPARTSELGRMAGESLPLSRPSHRPRRRRIAVGIAALGMLFLCAALVERPTPLLPELTALAATPMPVAGRAPEPTVAAAPVPTRGILIVRVDAPEAQLLVDGEVRRLDRGVWSAPAVGRHRIFAAAPDHGSVSFDVDVEAGRTVEVPMALTALRPIPHPTPAAPAKRRVRSVAAAPPDDFHTIDPWRKR